MRYVIIAPTYNQRSAGIRVLQELQKWLIRFGKDAIIPNININSPYQIEDDDIVVYPEIIKGNPLKAKRVVRYILNVPGKLGGDKEYDKDEIIVTYDGVLCQLKNNIHLQIPCVEEFFADRGCQRIVDCYWIGKGRNTQHPIVKDAIEITYTWPEKRRALAELLNRTKTFYTYDDRTALTLEAMLCGCEIKQIKDGEIIDVRPVGPLIDLENFKVQLNNFIQLTWYPEMDSNREATEYIESVISRRALNHAPLSRIPGLTSIIILTWNQLEYTKACLESIRAHTDDSYEIIFVDNGSSDGTVNWLVKQTMQDPKCRLIENGSNVGFSKGCNQGIKTASGDCIVLLNNDVVVTEGWLSGMMECLQSAPDIGIVGPMTNYISGPQKVPAVGYSSIEELAEYAQAFRLKNRHRRIHSRRVVGFCMLFKRQLIEEVGLLDESFVSGNFEDDDFCLRASLEGYRNTIAGDVFIHHFGNRTFIGNKIDYRSSLSGNIKVFQTNGAEKMLRNDSEKNY
jgi:GT2 family glycosyltransferase